MAGIRAMTNWMYRQSPINGQPATAGECTSLAISTKPKPKGNHDRSTTQTLEQAAAEWRSGGGARRNVVKEKEDYWTPTQVFPSQTKTENTTNSTSSSSQPNDEEQNTVIVNLKEEHPLGVIIPISFGLVSSMVVGGNGFNALRRDVVGYSLTEHIGGNLALDMVNSSGMQAILAGITWYLVGAAVVGIIRLIGSKDD